MEHPPPELLTSEDQEHSYAEGRSISRDEITALVKRIGLAGTDEALITRAHELNTELMGQLARIPDFGKDVEPAHVLAVPLR